MAASSPPVQRVGAGSAPLAAKPPGSARRLDALVAVAAVLVIAGAILDLSQHPSGTALLPAVIAIATLAALVTFLLGLIILGHWPVNSVYILGLFLGIDLIFAGAGWIGLGFGLHRAPAVRTA